MVEANSIVPFKWELDKYMKRKHGSNYGERAKDLDRFFLSAFCRVRLKLPYVSNKPLFLILAGREMLKETVS